MKKPYCYLAVLMMILVSVPIFSFAQVNYTYGTFKSTRVINTHTTETLQKRKLDILIGHRFGDLFGTAGGWQTFYGLETARDIFFGGEYGITDDLTVGISRTKGAGLAKANVNSLIKYRLLKQRADGKMPITLTILNSTSLSTMKKVDNLTLINSFPEFGHRLAYTTQLLIARKFGNTFSLQLIPSYTHRNLVVFGDDNGLFSFGIATRVQVTKVLGLLVDFTMPFSEYRNKKDSGFYSPLGIGLEFDTGGHIFQVNFTNATGIVENDYIPYTQSNWLDNQFRLGFTISRLFNL